MNKLTAYTLIIIGLILTVIAGSLVAFGTFNNSPPLVEEPEFFVPSWEPPEAPQNDSYDEIEFPVDPCPDVPGTPIEGEPTPTVNYCDLESTPEEKPEEPEPAIEEKPEEPVAKEKQEEPATISAPIHIRIDAIGVDHLVVDVGLNPDGSMEIPHDVNELGWYKPGVKPGELGSAVIAGHVDSRTQGAGAFYDLRHLRVGDIIHITDEDGTQRSWVVTDIARFNKDELPMKTIFRWDGDSADLVLVTCGGEFDRTARSYKDNIVVFSTPITVER